MCVALEGIHNSNAALSAGRGYFRVQNKLMDD